MTAGTGTPFVPFAAPAVGDEEIAAVVEVMRSGWLTSGPKAREFEKCFAEFTGGAEAIAVNSATAGLHLGLEALGVGPGDRVLTTPFTFTATAEVIRYLGADPVFVDIDPGTLNIDPAAIAAELDKGPPVKALIPVHYGGQACAMNDILALARSHGCKVMSDAAHAFPASYEGRPVGALGDDITVFSFYANKTITTGEGGMIVTRDAVMAARMRTMRLHGINRDVFERFRSKAPSWYYEVVAPGFKYNLPDLAAAIGVEQFRKAEALRAARERIARRYDQALKGLPLRLPVVARPEDTHAWHLYVIQLELDRLTLTRDQFIEELSARGVGTSVHYIPLHLQPYWRERYGLRPEQFPVASDAYSRVVSLPIYPTLSDQSLDHVIATVSEVLKSHER